MAAYVFLLNPGGKTYDLQKDRRNVDVDVAPTSAAIADALRRARAGAGDTAKVEGPDGRFQTLTFARGRWR